MNTASPVSLLYQTYNSLFLGLPFQGIATTGTQLRLFQEEISKGLQEDLSPSDILDRYWQNNFPKASDAQKQELMFRFIQYVERQVVLYDAIEESLFDAGGRGEEPGSLAHLFNNLRDAKQRSDLQALLKEFSVRIVLTAHPTQFYPGSVLGIINDLRGFIAGHDLVNIRLLLMQLGKTSFVNRQKPTPYDEAVSLGWYLENVFYEAIPAVVQKVCKKLQMEVSDFENSQLLSLGFWPGGDRDGNPFVTADLTIAVARRLREVVLKCYHRDIRKLRRRLTFKDVDRLVLQTEQRLYHTLYFPDREGYSVPGELLLDLQAIRNLLVREHEGLFLDLLDNMILKVRVFGFHFASMDIRQDSSVHRTLWESVLGDRSDASEDEYIRGLFQADIRKALEEQPPKPELRECYDTLQSVLRIQKLNGEAGCHRYIISNCGKKSQVMEVLALARKCMNTDFPLLDIVPLFETISDMRDAPAVMEALYQHPEYRTHLDSRGRVQTIMLGFSDGTKDGGYLMANWSIYKTKMALTAVSRRFGVKVLFFDGRGGPPGRGGGNNASFYAAHGPEVENHGIQVTVQGQTVSSTYGTVERAAMNIERLLAAGLGSNLLYAANNRMDAKNAELLERLGEEAYRAYMDLRNHAAFVPYLEKATPLKWFGETNIASRPTRRKKEGPLNLSDLRAIPFVGAWAQMKQNTPGYYGFGTAIKNINDLPALSSLYQGSLFFRTLVENAMQSLAKSNFQLTAYLSRDAEFGEFWQQLYRENVLSVEGLLAVSGQAQLLESNKESMESIAIREQIVLPALVIQQYALERLRREPLLPEEEKAVLHKLILRAMFGIINAARNAA